MTRPLFQRVLVPTASVEDAEATGRAVLPYLQDSDGAAVFVHVVEKTGGGLDKASVEQREEAAEQMFDAASRTLEAGGVDAYDAEILYGTDVSDAILAAARDRDATAVVFTLRGGSRWTKLLSEDVSTSLVNQADLPVVVLPNGGDDDG